jgi:hypothetical protein
MRQETIATLKKLTKGKTALSEEQLLALWEDLAGASRDEVLGAVRPPPANPPKPKPPEWLKQILAKGKSTGWLARDQVDHLVRAAIADDLIKESPFRGKLPALSSAAKMIAGEQNGERLAVAFAEHIRLWMKEHRLG